MKTMWSNILDRVSFLSIFLAIILLPIFFLPFTGIPIEISKGLLLVVGISISLIFWTISRFSVGRVNLPRSPLIFSGAGIVLAVFLSAFFSDAPEMSFFGVIFDLGTFWFMFAAFMLMLISSMMVKDSQNARMLLFGVILSSVVVSVFQIFRFFMPEIFSLSVFEGKAGNLVGSLNTLGLLAGFSALASLFIIEFFPITKRIKFILGAFILIFLFLVASVNYILIWELLGIFSLLIFVYKISFFSRTEEEEKKSYFPAFSFGVFIVSLLFFISGQFIGSFLPQKLALSNTEVSPSISGTFAIMKESLKENPVFGVGPNKFGEAWAIHKSLPINSTIFWDVFFTSGSGILPTFASTTGGLGILSWLVFLGFFFVEGVKSLFVTIKQNMNREAGIFFLLSLYLFSACFFYSAGLVIFLLAFAFTGVFIGLLSNREKGEYQISFLDDHRKSFFSILSLVVIMIASATVAFKYIERFASVPHFRKSVQTSSVTEAEASIVKALSLYNNDLYLRTYAQIFLVKLNSLLSENPSGLSDAQKADLQKMFDQAVLGASGAIAYNPKNYLNHQSLGNVYSVAGTLGVANAYPKAIESFMAASDLNPLNPRLKLAIAQINLSNKNQDEAKKFANEALSLKPDYIDAILMLSQVARAGGDSKSALSYAEQALSLSPSNQDLLKYVDSLKAGN